MGPRYIGPFRIIVRVDKVAYRQELPEEISQIHNTLHVSRLWKCVLNKEEVVSLDDIQFDECMNYIETPVAILERKVKVLWNMEVPLVKVQWEHPGGI